MNKYKKGDKFIIEISDDGHFNDDVLVYGIKNMPLTEITEAGLNCIEKIPNASVSHRRTRYELLQNPSDMTDEEKERLERIKRIPTQVFNLVEKRCEELHFEIMDLERKYDSLNDFLNGYAGIETEDDVPW